MVIRPTLSDGLKPVAPMNAITASTFGSTADDVGDLPLAVRHRVERDVLRRLDEAEELPRVLARQEALGHAGEEHAGRDDDDEERDHRRARPREHPAQA